MLVKFSLLQLAGILRHLQHIMNGSDFIFESWATCVLQICQLSLFSGMLYELFMFVLANGSEILSLRIIVFRKYNYITIITFVSYAKM